MIWESAVDKFTELLIEDEIFQDEHGGEYNALLGIFIVFYLLFGVVFYKLQIFLKEYEENEKHHVKESSSNKKGIREGGSGIKESDVELKQSIMTRDSS